MYYLLHAPVSYGRKVTHLLQGCFRLFPPQGPLVVRWDMKSQRRRVQFQAHRDAVMCMLRSPSGELVVTTSYSGGVRLWSGDWECLCEAAAPMAYQSHVSLGMRLSPSPR